MDQDTRCVDCYEETVSDKMPRRSQRLADKPARSMAPPTSAEHAEPNPSPSSADDGPSRDPRLLHAVDEDVFSRILGHCGQRDVVCFCVALAASLASIYGTREVDAILI